jgi:hypothetical protein
MWRNRASRAAPTAVATSWRAGLALWMPAVVATTVVKNTVSEAMAIGVTSRGNRAISSGPRARIGMALTIVARSSSWRRIGRTSAATTASAIAVVVPIR